MFQLVANVIDVLVISLLYSYSNYLYVYLLHLACILCTFLESFSSTDKIVLNVLYTFIEFTIELIIYTTVVYIFMCNISVESNDD